MLPCSNTPCAQVHSEQDDGTQPYGNAGLPEAYGVIGIASTAAGGTNLAQAPSVPDVDKVICTFQSTSTSPTNPTIDGQPASTGSISGSALLHLLEPDRPGVVRMQARLLGLTPSATHSFHFHAYGDMTVGLTGAGLGAIYSANAIVVESLAVNAQGFGLFDEEFASDTLLQHVGRSLTIHQGPDSSSPTIAAAACGLANPRATIDTTGAHAASEAGLSGGVIALLVIAFPAALIFLCISCMYYHRMPIPCCGTYLYAREGLMQPVPPPPPPPPAPPPGQGVTMTQAAMAPNSPYGVRVEKL